MGEIVLSGIEWKRIIEIGEKMFELDNILREVAKKTIFRDRNTVEIAMHALKSAKKSKRWYHYVEQKFDDDFSKVITFTNNCPEFDMKIGYDEVYIESVPERVRFDVTDDVLLGISWIMCKARVVSEIVGLTDYGNELAGKTWNRCLLYGRRRIAGKKAAWRRKGFIAEYDEVPDYRKEEYHEGGRLFYDIQ